MTRTILCAVVLLALSSCFSGHAETAGEPALRVRRGSFVNDVIISGELEAARGELLTVPPLPNWQKAIKWLADDGVAVEAGDPVAELDNSALTSDLDSKRQTAMQATQELQQKESEWSADLEQKELEVEKKKSDLDKAILDAKLPRELVSGRSFEEKQNALRRAPTEHEKAVDLLTARRTAVAAERQNLTLNIEKTSRDIARAESA